MHMFRLLLDSIFPPTEGALIVRRYTPEQFLTHYHEHTVDDVIALSDYLRPVVHAAITECKFQHNSEATTLLAALVAKWLSTRPDARTLLIPIPLSRERRMTRGYNQVEDVATRASASLTHITLGVAALSRVRDTPPQTGLGRHERLTNLEDAFTVSPAQVAALAHYDHIIICDDVTTTGATLKAARAALAPHLPPSTTLTCVAWAH